MGAALSGSDGQKALAEASAVRLGSSLRKPSNPTPLSWPNKPPTLMDSIVSLCKRRGFIFQASEIYGGMGNTYDYGPPGGRAPAAREGGLVGGPWSPSGPMWWVSTRAIIQHPKVWETSGHLTGFSDPMVDCKTCKGRFRADKLEDARCLEKPSKIPGQCHGELTEPRDFNLMFKTQVGALEGSSSVAYLRPETAQGIFLNFKNVMDSARTKPPFGIAQIGKSFRNEITPGNFVFRTREFEQAEMEFFVPPARGRQVVQVLVRGTFSVVPGLRYRSGETAHARA